MRHASNLVVTEIHSTLGPITLAASAAGLAGAWFTDQRHYPDTTGWTVDDRHPVLLLAMAQLRQFLTGERRGFDLPLDLDAGTSFQRAVWQALLQIPVGTTCSYGALGARIGKPSAVRAVGAAVGRNPLSIIVPCHRVVGADGALTGYAGGLPRKAWLLALESGAGPMPSAVKPSLSMHERKSRTISS
jgi:methylated-DNA-[protein]-cysteine S-methyltransferase